ncbi:MAG: DUF2800 domain-containing protein [Candidatus Sabulitectum sp.]|nr:DUF2800 domain-containing protein [Candidatus Sabulitectum sp.]
MGHHAKLSPSGGDRWAFCTAAPGEEEKYPEQETSSFAQEGTDAHDLLERSVKSKTRPSELEPDHPACKDVDLMFDMVQPYLDSPRYIVLCEVKVKLCEDVYGTADLVVIDLEKLMIAVWDYKHGRGVLVEVPNIQTEIYLAAAIKTLDYLFPAPMKEAIAGIVQPRAPHPDGPVRQVGYTIEEITGKGEAIICIAAQITAGDVKFCPGEKACKWCLASGNCDAQAEAAIKASGFSPIKEGTTAAPVIEVNSLTVGKRVAIHESRGFITDFLNAVSIGLEKAILAGEEVPGLKVVAGQSRRKFDPAKTEEEIIKVLKEACKLKPAQYSPPKLVTGPQALKLIDVKKRGGKKKMEALLAIIVKPQGKPTVVSEDDARDSIAPHFKPVETGNPLD